MLYLGKQSRGGMNISGATLFPEDRGERVAYTGGLYEYSARDLTIRVPRTVWYAPFIHKQFPRLGSIVSRCGLAVRRLAGKQKDLGSIRFGSPFSSLQKLWFMDTVS